MRRHLASFSYTLDLTDVNQITGIDPMVAFLTDFKRGNCEYFAGAMALMCQSLSIPARVVIGFRCDDYNSVGGYVFGELGRLPKRGDTIVANGYEIRVESVRENRIEAVRISSSRDADSVRTGA